MFSFKILNKESRTVGIIKNKEKKTVELLYFTEKTRDLKGIDYDFDSAFKKYGKKTSKGYFTLENDYTFEMAPHNKVTEKFPRFVNYYLAKSNSGKSYQIADSIRKYLKAFPENQIFYASANPLSNDKNYSDLIDKINEIDLMQLNSVIDFKELKDCLVVFDDCDSMFSTSLSDLDERLTEENVKELSITQKNKALKMMKNKSEDVQYFLKESIKSLLNCGRKNNISIINVGHKYNDGAFQMVMISESTGVILFPYTTTKAIFSTFLTNKLSFDKDEVKEILSTLEFYQYDFFFVNNSGSRFIMSNDTIKIF